METAARRARVTTAGLFLWALARIAWAQPDADDHPWPSFRGDGALGHAPSLNLPQVWDAASGENIRWQRRIPGLAHSSPIVWGHRLFLTSAISSRDGATFRPGLYGDGDASADDSVHRWALYAFDKRNGELLWEGIAHEGKPREKRHIKATYADATPATDGRFVAAFFGSQGLYVYTVEGDLVWQQDLGRLDVGAYDVPSYEWGPSSSPILFEGKVIVQCDTQEESFLAAFDVESGREIWRVARDELPSWGTPTVARTELGMELVTNGSNFIRAYDPDTGRELWRLGGSSKITAPTPIWTARLIFVTSGRAPERPIFAIRAGSRGDLSLPTGRTSSESIAWSRVRRGAYMPTPIITGGILYVLENQGIFSAYSANDGTEIYRERLAHGGLGFSASPVTADQRLYLSSEGGEIFVIRTGKEFEILARNDMGEPLMATPALSEDTMYVRGRDHLFAIGQSTQRGRDRIPVSR